jgi:uncharacterized protein (UPF0332 family)
MIFSNQDYIQYRMERANESFAEAKLLAESNHWNTVANRLYYSCFYAVIALLLKNEINAKTHSGVRNKFHEFIFIYKTIDLSCGRLYSKLFDLRQSGDYEDMVILDKETVEPLISMTQSFLEEVHKLIVSDET